MIHELYEYLDMKLYPYQCRLSFFYLSGRNIE